MYILIKTITVHKTDRTTVVANVPSASPSGFTGCQPVSSAIMTDHYRTKDAMLGGGNMADGW
jgi:hypothetical protein